MRSSYDVVVVGGGHNGLVAAAYLARAGRSVLLLERLAEVGGAAVSRQVFTGVDVRLSAYSYLVSLLPDRVVADLGLQVTLADVVADELSHDVVRGVALTDGLIGTHADVHAADGLAGRCFLYHVIGNGTGQWRVPVGGMGAVTGAMALAARSAGAELLTRATV